MMNDEGYLVNVNAQQRQYQTNIDSNNASVSRTPYVQPNPSLFCIFCSTANHHSHECQKYNSSQLFWEKVLVDRRCKNCLRLYHRSDKCFNRSYCRLFGCKRTDKHNPVLCHVRYVKYQQPFFRCEKPWLSRSQPHWPAPHYHKKRHHNLNLKFNTKYDFGPGNRDKFCNTTSTLVHSFNNSSDCSVPVVKIDASTQTDCESNISSCEEKISQCSQTENSLVTTSMNTALRIHKDCDIFQYFPLPGQDNSKSDVKVPEICSQQHGVRDIPSSSSAATLPSFLQSAVKKFTEISNNISNGPVENSTSFSVFSQRKF